MKKQAETKRSVHKKTTKKRTDEIRYMKTGEIPKVGDRIQQHGGVVRTVIDVLPYTGKYDFICVLRLSSTQTRSGYIEMAWSNHEYFWRYVK